jgi:hypothetical protein
MGNNLSRPTSFQAFYPIFGRELARVRDQQCSTAYASYQSSTTYLETLARCNVMMDCFYEHVRETVKIQMATTNIVLGLTPTILSMMGSSTIELSVLSTQRPLLALCISLGSPSVWPMRPFEPIDLKEEMRPRAQRMMIPSMGPCASIAVTALQYVAVLGSIANVTSIAYDLGWKSISYTFSCNQRFGALLWVFLAAAIHIAALVGFTSRLRHPVRNEQPSGKLQRIIAAWLTREATPCISHERRSIIWGPENVWYLFFSFCANAGTAVHMVFGIATLGSVQLVGAADAGTIIARFLASALVCRCVLMFELAGLRERLDVTVGDEQEGIPVVEGPEPEKSKSTASAQQCII